MSEDSNRESHAESRARVVPLTEVERLAAGGAGLGLLCAGAVSVFLTSKQGGSAALLGVGAILLVFAVHGMPLIGAKVPGLDVSMATRRKDLVDQVKREDPIEGQRKLDVLELLDPSARYAPEVLDAYSVLYRKELDKSLAEAVAEIPEAMLVRTSHEPGRTEMRVEAPGRTIDVEIAFSHSDRSTLGTQPLQFTYGAAARSGMPRILITNMRIPNEVAEIADEYDPSYRFVRVVRWRDPLDDMALKYALEQLGLPGQRL